MARRSADKVFVACVKNRGYRASLVLRRIYERIPDPDAEARGLYRVIDESGEDYLYPANHFVALELARSIQRAIAGAI